MQAGSSKPAWAGRDSRLRRHNRALMELTRRLWHDDHDFSAALSAITETGADILGVERVNVWELQGKNLQCVHGYQRSVDVHNPVGYDELLDLDDSGYAAELGRARVIHSDDVHAEPGAHAADALALYLNRHAIRSLLDAPVFVGGDLFGVICHEQIDAARHWQPDEIAFAGNMGDFVALAVEIERRKRAEEQLDYLKLFDPISGLGNRTAFHAEVRQFLRRLQRRPRLAAMLFIDIDRFYTVNAAAGEIGGDAMLGVLGERVNASTSDDAIVARVESDCFAVLLPELQFDWQAARQAEDILQAVSGVAEVGEQSLEVSASIGIAFADGSTLTNPDEWLRDADLASKQAKERGRNRYEVFDVDHHRTLVERLSLEYGLRDALKNEQLVVAYQPEIDLNDGRVLAAEALLRWRQADGSLRVAGEFIDVAEHSGLILPIGSWVLQRACHDAAGWPKTAGTGATVRINLSARQFEQPGLSEAVADALRDSGLPPQQLCLEITETVLMTHAEGALDTLRQLRSLGVSLAIDDFGTGYSSLVYLKRFPVDTLKIDRGFVAGLPDNGFDRAIVEAVIGLARNLGMEVVAEGVELETQAACLRACGIHRAQGWLYAAALEQPALIAYLTKPRD